MPCCAEAGGAPGRRASFPVLGETNIQPRVAQPSGPLYVRFGGDRPYLLPSFRASSRAALMARR